MQDKLQELTDRLYNEGLSKGKMEGEEMLAKARKEADAIVEEARRKAEQIISDAEKEAGQIRAKVSGDIKMASTQTISAVRQQVESIITAKAAGAPVAAAMADGDFVKELLRTVVGAFNASSAESAGLDVILPAQMKQRLGDNFASQVKAELGKGIDVDFVKGLSNGFKIGPKDGGYILSFTADDFSNLIGEYLRPATRKILFGE